MAYTNRLDEYLPRLKTYPGPRNKNEEWKNDKDLTNCTLKEMQELQRMGLTVGECMGAGLTRGQVHHICFGWRYPGPWRTKP